MCPLHRHPCSLAVSSSDLCCLEHRSVDLTAPSSCCSFSVASFSPCNLCTNNTCICIVTETHFCFLALCKQTCVHCGPQRGSCKPSIRAHSYGVSQLLALHMLMKTNNSLIGDRDWLMFDQVAIKKHGWSSILLENKAEQNPMGQEIKSFF